MKPRNREVLAIALSVSLLLSPTNNSVKEDRALPPEPIKIEGPIEIKDKDKKLRLKN
jgi:hypothetical protein